MEQDVTTHADRRPPRRVIESASRRDWMRYAVGVGVGASTAPWTVAQESEKTTRLRVLTYNIHHGRGGDGKVDLARQAKVIRDARPDLVVLQEVDNQTKRTGGVDQTVTLAKLTGLHSRFARQIDFQGGEYGQAILSRFPIDELVIHRLPGMPEREQRIAAEGRVRIGNQTVSIVGTHLHHRSEPIRVQQAAKLNELFSKPDHRVILAGDLNALPESKPMQLLNQQWRVLDSERPLLTFPAAKPVRQIDYVLVRPSRRFRPVRVEVIAAAVASDHRPVLAVIDLL